MKILLTHGQQLFRDGLKELLLKKVEFQTMIIDCNSLAEARQITQQHSDIDIGILLMTNANVRFDQYLSYIEALTKICMVLVVSPIEEPKLIRQIVNAGARGYIAGSQSSEVFIAAIQLILSGGLYLPHFLLSNTDKAKTSQARDFETLIMQTDPLSDRVKYLTNRQKEVLSLLSSGASNKEIGDVLALSEATIRTHIAAIYKILNVNNRTQASKIAFENGLIKSFL